MDVNKLMAELERKHPGESEYLQAVREVLMTVEEAYNQHPEFEANRIAERIVEPDRIFTFKVVWVDDKGDVQVNLGYRIQFNNAIGPYKGGLRFHPSVNPSILKFLGFEQIFKNALTTLPMGGAKGGSDFNPKGKSDREVMRFCQAFMVELWRHIGPETDVPAGDIGVGGREIGYLYGMYRKLARENTGVLTGKGMTYGGSLIRPEATGFGAVYFLRQMLEKAGMDIKGQTIAISGFGNVAWGAATKATELGAKVVTISGPDGYIYDPAGLDAEKIAYMLHLRASNNDVVEPYAKKFPGSQFFAGKKPWEVKVDIAMPCVTQNELDGGSQCRRCICFRSGNDAERTETQLDGRGGRCQVAPDHVVHPSRMPRIRHREGRLHQLYEGRQYRRLHEGCQVDGRTGCPVKTDRNTQRSGLPERGARFLFGDGILKPGTPS